MTSILLSVECQGLANSPRVRVGWLVSYLAEFNAKYELFMSFDFEPLMLEL